MKRGHLAQLLEKVTIFNRYLAKPTHSKTCVKQPLSKRTKNGFQDQLSPNSGQEYCRMLPLEHSAILSTIKRPLVIKIFVLSFLSTGPSSAVGNVSGYRCLYDCRFRGRDSIPVWSHTFVETKQTKNLFF